MTEPVSTKTPQAWQPLTPRGVAAFAEAPYRRLLFFQITLAFLTAVSVLWFLKADWFPVIRTAILALPESGRISAGKLEWHGDSPQLLAEGHFLAFVVDTNRSATIRSPAHLQVEFAQTDIRVISLGGYYSEFYYTNLEPFPFNRVELEAWWGAWQPPISWMAFGGAIIWCFASWTALTIVYALPVWLVAFFANRRLKFAGACKLIGAALVPGAILMLVGIFLYGVGLIDLIQFAALFITHLVIGWIYTAWATVAVPKIQGAPQQGNPFRVEEVSPPNTELPAKTDE